MIRKYSVIIPTLWKSDKIFRMMKIYESCPHIGEVIVIDNSPTSYCKLIGSKVRMLKMNANIYVNPAWNLGVKNSVNEWLIIANDDVYIQNLTSLLDKVNESDHDLVGVDIEKCGKDSGVELKGEDSLHWGFGCFMIMNKEIYKPIPPGLKIWFGDNIIFSNAKKPAYFSGIRLETVMGTTIKNGFNKIAQADKPVFEKLHKVHGYKRLAHRPKELKIVPYTVNVGEYDAPRNDILCFSDYSRFTNPERNSRIYFILPHKFIECDISILVSCEVTVKVPYDQLVKEWLGDYDMALFRHPWRNCVHEEIKAAEVRIKRKDELEILRDQGRYYESIGVPKNMGNLPETAIIIRRHNDIVKRFCEAWWAEICRWSYRDQCSFSVVLRDFPQLKVRFITPDVRVHPYTSIGKHLK